MKDPLLYLCVSCTKVKNKTNFWVCFIINEAFEAEQRNVDIAWLENGYAAVKSGLTEGSIVVTSGATYLYEGAVVSVYKQQ